MSEDPAALGDNPHSQRSVTVGKYPQNILAGKVSASDHRYRSDTCGHGCVAEPWAV